MKAIILCLILSFLGTCCSQDLSPHLWPFNNQQASQIRHTRQTIDPAATCTNCSLSNRDASLLQAEAQCETQGYFQSMIDIYAQCGQDDRATLLAATCAQKENGEYCFGDDRTAYSRAQGNCFIQSSTCSPECRSALQSVRDEYGCCVHSSWNNTMPQPDPLFSYSLWSRCGVETVNAACANSLTFTPVSNPRNCSREESEMMTREVVCSAVGQRLIDRLNTHNCTQPTAYYFVHVACARNNKSEYCDTRLPSNLRRTCTQSGGRCSSACREGLITAKDELGCCANNLLIDGFLPESPPACTTRNFWEDCDVPSSGLCDTSLTLSPSKGHSIMATASSLLMLAILVIVLL